MRPIAAAALAALLGASLLHGVACKSDRDPPRGLAPASGGGGSGLIATHGSGSGSGASGGAGGGGADVIADPEAPCDGGIAIDSEDPTAAARALGICKDAADDQDWGLIDARWTAADGGDPTDDPDWSLGHGLLGDFGDVSPREGQRMLALSSGAARAPGDNDFVSPAGFDKGYISPSPAGFPKPAPACPGVVTGATHDDVALELVLRAPPEARALAFDFDFFTFEWPDYVCSEFNDYFVALLAPAPTGQSDGNISFDSDGNSVSVNNALVRVCDCANGPPCAAPPLVPRIEYDCAEGAGELADTGFETHAATSWLATEAPVEPGGELTLRFAVWDSGDGVLDSTVVIDAFRWLGDTPDDDEPVTNPIE
jgi:hypothetical protein